MGSTLLLAKKILQEIEVAVATWRDEGQSIGMTGAELDQFADAFEHSQREIVKKLERSTTRWLHARSATAIFATGRRFWQY